MAGSTFCASSNIPRMNLGRGSDELLILPRGDLRVAAENKLFYFRPIHCSKIKAQADPAPGADIGGEVEFPRVPLDQPVVVIGQNLAADADDAVPVMIVEVIRKHFFRHEKAGVVSFVFAHRGGECQANLGECK